jgi:hypothetical protein
MFRLLTIFCIAGILFSCRTENKEYHKQTADPTIYHESFKALTDVIVHDIFSPPVASRIYTYASVAGYEAARWQDASMPSFSSSIKHFPPMTVPDTSLEYSYEMASTLAMLRVGKALIFSEDSITRQIQKAEAFYKKTGMPDDVYSRSAILADSVAAHVLRWSSKDNYKQSRSFPKYSLQNDASTWKPTPPGYMDGVEPSWNKIRTVMMDSASQFMPARPTKYDVSKGSQYYNETMEVYNSVKNATPEMIEIANFWDCNPYKLNVTGHVMHATKKISPGGHWINITATACRKAKLDFVHSTRAYAAVSIGLFDAFISCWDEKYRSVATRPETVINENIDPEWVPLLQTPPFPEYPSGHSVASGAASVILTHIFGDNFAFTDETEVEFGLKPRSFTSFKQAADEASVSRLYGGIHFMPAITNGVSQGRAIGELVSQKCGLAR